MGAKKELMKNLQFDQLIQRNVLSGDIEYEINLLIGQIVFKYNEDLIIRAKAIARLKVDLSI